MIVRLLGAQCTLHASKPASVTIMFRVYHCPVQSQSGVGWAVTAEFDTLRARQSQHTELQNAKCNYQSTFRLRAILAMVLALPPGVRFSDGVISHYQFVAAGVVFVVL